MAFLKAIFFNENVCILIQISLILLPKGSTVDNLALIQVMAWNLLNSMPLSEAVQETLSGITRLQWFNSSPPSAAYMRQWIRSALVQIMVCRLFGAKPLSNQCWVIVNWNLRNKLQWNFDQIKNLSFMKMRLQISSAKWLPFCPGGDELMDHGINSLMQKRCDETVQRAGTHLDYTNPLIWNLEIVWGLFEKCTIEVLSIEVWYTPIFNAFNPCSSVMHGNGWYSINPCVRYCRYNSFDVRTGIWG